MRITLIRPRTGNTPDPPQGLLIIATCAREAGHEIQILDPNPDDTGVMDQIADFAPDLIGYSVLTTQVSRTLELQKQVRKQWPDMVTVAGGIHPTALPEWTLRNLHMDYVVIGEGEITFMEFLTALKTGADPVTLPGMAAIRDDTFVAGSRRPMIPDLDTISIPDHSLIDFTRYLRPPGNIRGKFLRRATSIITSRGCPFGCIFCSSHDLFGRKVRRRSIPHIMKEIDQLITDYRVDGLWFLDDTLLEDPDWLLALCGELKKTGLPWGCQAHVRRADETLFRAMRDAGCAQLEFGVESGSERVLQRLRKGSTPDDARRAFALCRKLGIRTLANFMIGIPDETEEDAEKSLRLAREIRPNHVVVTFTTPLPGSDLYREALEKEWIKETPDFSSDWIIRQTENPAVSLTMDPETMKTIRKKFDNAFFWTNIREYFLYPRFVLEIAMHILTHPRQYLPGFKQAIRTGRLSHLVETVWEEYNRV